MLIQRTMKFCSLSEVTDFCFQDSPFALLFLFDSDKTPKEQQYPKAMHLMDPSMPSLPELKKDPQGKPYLENADLYISFTDCHNIRIVGISNIPLGIDLEKVRPIHWEKIVKRFFHQEEIQAIHNEKDFFTLWTCKESYVKYTGNGITDEYAGFSVLSLSEIITTANLEDDWFLSICTPHECSIRIIDLR